MPNFVADEKGNILNLISPGLDSAFGPCVGIERYHRHCLAWVFLVSLLVSNDVMLGNPEQLGKATRYHPRTFACYALVMRGFLE